MARELLSSAAEARTQGNWETRPRPDRRSLEGTAPMIDVHDSRLIERPLDATAATFRSSPARWLSPVLDDRSPLSWWPFPNSPSGPHMHLRIGGVWEVGGGIGRHVRTAPHAMRIPSSLRTWLIPRLDAWIRLQPAGIDATEMVVSGAITGRGTHWLVRRFSDPRQQSGFDGILDLLASRLALVDASPGADDRDAVSFRLPLPAARPIPRPQAAAS